MELKGLQNYGFVPKETLGRKAAVPALNPQFQNQSNNSDSIKLSPIAKGPDEGTVSSNLSSLGTRLFNQPVLDHFLEFRKKATHLPVVKKIDQATANGASVKDLINIAYHEVKNNDKNISSVEALDKSYEAVLASVIENKYSDPNFFNGEKDKIFHYFVSGSLTVDAYKKLSFMPHKMKVAIASNSVLTIGWLKEVASIPGNGYGADDMQANRAGIKAAIASLDALNKG